MSKFKNYIKTMDKTKKIVGISVVGIVILSLALLFGYINGSKTMLKNDKNDTPKELIVQQVEKINKYKGDKTDFHFNKYWKDMSGGVYNIKEDENSTNVEYKKKQGNDWVYMSSPVEGNLSDFNYITLKVKGEKGKKLFLKIEESAIELKAKFFTLNGKEQLLTLDISDITNKSKLNSLKEVMLFAAPGEIQDGNFTIMDAWFSTETPVINKYVGDKKDFHFNKYWEDIFNHGIAIDEENSITTMSFTKPVGNNWILASAPVDGKLSDFNYVTVKVKGEPGQKFLLKLENKDKVYGEKLVELSGEEEVVIVELKKDDIAGLDSLKEVRIFPNAGEPEGGKLDILDAWFSVEKPQGFKEAGQAEQSEASSEYINGWKIEEWTKYIAENVNGLTKVSYNNPAAWANFTYNIEGKISGNNLLNIYLNSNGCDHVMIKLRGKFKYVDPVGGFNVYEEAEVFNSKIKQGETNVQVDITDAVKQLGYVTDVVMFVESNQDIQGLDRIGSLTFGTPKFTLGTVADNSTSSTNEWLVDGWTGYSSEVKDGFTRISYENVEPWANITYNIKNLLKDNDILELKLNSNGCDHVQIKLRGKYLNSAPGYKVYEESLVFDGRLNNGEKTLKIDLKDAIKELGIKNISDIVMFVESSQAVTGLDRKGTLDIYTPVFKKNITSNEETENPNEDKNVVINSTFNSSLGNWEVFSETGKGQATGEVKNGAAVVDINNIGTENWNVQFVNKKLKLEKGATYKYSIRLKSSVKRPTEIVIQEDGGAYTQFVNESESLTDKYQLFEKEFKYTGEDTTKLSFAINLGKVKGLTNLEKHTIYVDEVKLVKVTDENEEKPDPEVPDQIIKGTKKYELEIPEEKLSEIGGKITDVIVFVESDGTIEDVDRNGEIEILETALLNKEGKKKRVDTWTTDTNWNQYKISSDETKTIIKYNNVEQWATIWGKVNEDNNYNDKLSIIFNTNGCDHLIVKVKGINGNEVELGKEYVKNMIDTQVPSPEVPDQIIKGTKKYELEISEEKLSEIGGKITDIIVFVESDGTIEDVDRNGEIEILETALLNKEGKKKRLDTWTTDTNWNQYQISSDDTKTIIKYNNVAQWATIWGKVNEDNNYNDKLSIIFNTNGCDHLIVKVKGINGNEVELGKEYVKNMSDSDIPEIPEQEEPTITNIVTADISSEVLEKLGGSIDSIIMFVESNPYAGEFDKLGTLEIMETAFENTKGGKIMVDNWTTNTEWNQYQISNTGETTVVQYNAVQDWAYISAKVNNYSVDFNKLVLKLNTANCDHITIKLKGINGKEEELKQQLLLE